MKTPKSLLLPALLAGSILTGCGSAAILSTPIENIDNTPIKSADLSEKEEQVWGHLDLIKDTIPGMSIQKAYAEIIKGKRGKSVTVAIIDSGIDIDHEDLDGVVWTNKEEIPNNGKDDDNNGYVDDVHGWNFLGDAYNEQLEYVRLLASGNTNHPDYSRAQSEHSKEHQKYTTLKAQYDQILQQIEVSDKAVATHLKKPEYTKKEVNAIKTEDQELLQHVSVIKQTYGFGFETITEAKKALKSDLTHITEFLNYYLNKNHNGRSVIGDDPNDINDRNYGNGNVRPSKEVESHGTHVAGIVAAERNNGKGVNGIANNVKIMAIRAVPNGDEYDKDIALAIRYAVDNGAKVVNMSFGKYYSPHTNWVKDAIIYASQKDVLLVSGAGNESLNLDKKLSFPNDQDPNGAEISDTFLSVGATEPKYGSGVVSNYSNYGKSTVDLFAPGSQIYSTVPNNDYSFEQGTSMAAPAVAGIAALIRSQYPNLSAKQVKQILMDSGLSLKAKVVVGGDSSNIKPFSDLSKSAKLVNAYNALLMAQQISKN